MIRMVEYYKVEPRLIMGFHERYTDIEKFVKVAREILESDGTLLMVLEPGDATRYEFLIIQCGMQLAIALVTHGWSFFCTCDPMTVCPGEIERKTGMKINPYTTGVICQILQDIYGGLRGPYYSWKKSGPIGRSIPEGAEEPDAETE